MSFIAIKLLILICTLYSYRLDILCQFNNINYRRIRFDFNSLQSVASSLKSGSLSLLKDDVQIYNISAVLKHKFALLCFLYLLFGTYGTFIDNASENLMSRHFDAAVWIRVRLYLDYTITSTTNLYVKRKYGQYSSELKLASLNAMNDQRNFHKNVTMSFFKGYTVEGVHITNGTAAPEFWDKMKTKKYFGNLCLNMLECGSPVIGHRSLMLASRFVSKMTRKDWIDSLVEMQLKTVQSESYLQGQKYYWDQIDETFIKRYERDVIICIIIVFVWTVAFFLTFYKTLKTIDRLGLTHNRIQILQEICSNKSTEVLNSTDIVNK